MDKILGYMGIWIKPMHNHSFDDNVSEFIIVPRDVEFVRELCPQSYFDVVLMYLPRILAAIGCWCLEQNRREHVVIPHTEGTRCHV